MRLLPGSAAIVIAGLVASVANAQTLIHTTGVHAWNNDANWSSPPFPNASGAVVVIPARTSTLTVDLSQPITIGSLTVNKDSNGTVNL